MPSPLSNDVEYTGICVFKLAVLKIIAVLKTLRVKVSKLSCAFGGTVCLKVIVDGFQKWQYHIFITMSNFDMQSLHMCSSRCF